MLKRCQVAKLEVKAKEQEIRRSPYIMQCGAYKPLPQQYARKLDIAFQGISSEIRKKDGSSVSCGSRAIQV